MSQGRRRTLVSNFSFRSSPIDLVLRSQLSTLLAAPDSAQDKKTTCTRTPSLRVLGPRRWIRSPPPAQAESASTGSRLSPPLPSLCTPTVPSPQVPELGREPTGLLTRIGGCKRRRYMGCRFRICRSSAVNRSNTACRSLWRPFPALSPFNTCSRGNAPAAARASSSLQTIQVSCGIRLRTVRWKSILRHPTSTMRDVIFIIPSILSSIIGKHSA